MHPFQIITLKHACMTNMHSILWRCAISHWGEVFGMCFLFLLSETCPSIQLCSFTRKGNWASLNGVSRITFFSEDWSNFQTFRRTETMFSLVSEAFSFKWFGCICKGKRLFKEMALLSTGRLDFCWKEYDIVILCIYKEMVLPSNIGKKWTLKGVLLL